MLFRQPWSWKTSHSEGLKIFATSCQEPSPLAAHSESLVGCFSFPKPLNDPWIILSPWFQQLMKIRFLLRRCFGVPTPLMARPLALSIGCWTGLRAKSFYSCSFLMHVVEIADHQYYLLPLRVPWHILRLPSYANQTIRTFETLSFSCIFPVRKSIFRKAGSALDEVSTPLLQASMATNRISSLVIMQPLKSFKPCCLKLSFCWILAPKGLRNGLSDTFTKTWSGHGGLSSVFVVSSLPAIVVGGSK